MKAMHLFVVELQLAASHLPRLFQSVSVQAVAPMPEARSDASAVVLQGYLYICGGQDHWMLAEVNV